MSAPQQPTPPTRQPGATTPDRPGQPPREDGDTTRRNMHIESTEPSDEPQD